MRLSQPTPGACGSCLLGSSWGRAKGHLDRCSLVGTMGTGCWQWQLGVSGRVLDPSCPLGER